MNDVELSGESLIKCDNIIIIIIMSQLFPQTREGKRLSETLTIHPQWYLLSAHL